MLEKVSNPEATPGAEGPKTFGEFQSLKKGDTKTSAEVPAKPETKNEPEAAPGKTETPEKKVLTPEERSARDKARNEQRFAKLERERKEATAKAERLERELEAARKSKTAESSPATPDEKPKRADFTSQIGEGKKYADWDAADEAYQEARDAWNEKQITSKLTQEKQRESSAQESAKVLESYEKKLADYAEKTEGFDESRELVADYIEETLGERNPISTAIVRCDNPAEVIEHLATHPDLLRDIAKMPPSMATLKIGAISAKFDKAETPSPSKETTDAPRSPSTVKARGEVPNYVQTMNKADDFRKFKEGKTAAKKAGARF